MSQKAEVFIGGWVNANRPTNPLVVYTDAADGNYQNTKYPGTESITPFQDERDHVPGVTPQPY